ncbi:MAG: hypothetical protein KF721_10890 [Ignavibacteriaceae bacterium]|nr:hypothetical protein [Ignavibacteriaceae bacterium]
MKNQSNTEVEEKIIQIIPCTKPLFALYKDDLEPENPIKEEIHLFALVEIVSTARASFRVIKAIDRNLEFVDKAVNFIGIEPGNE